MGLIIGLFCIAFILWEAFETIILPRTVTRGLRLTRLIGRVGWSIWKTAAGLFPPGSRRETFLGYFAPLTLPFLLAIWAIGMVLGYGLVQWSLGMPISAPEPHPGLGSYLYMSGTTLFTLGYGDLTPRSNLGRILAVAESGTGIGFLAAIIGYLPVLYQAFSRREVAISLLDARAGTPPAACEFLRRHASRDDLHAIPDILAEWERWASELLESNLSYPILAQYRSQHDRESWLSALTMVMDVCSLIIVGVDGVSNAQAKLTFAMARHAAIDTGLIFDCEPVPPQSDRLAPAELSRLRALLTTAGVPLKEGPEADALLDKLRRLYEPHVNALSLRFLFDLPPWIADDGARDNWQTSGWDRETRGQLHF